MREPTSACASAPDSTRTERVERGAQVLILGVVGCAAGAVSFTHVHEWSMIQLPAGTPDAFGWVNASVSELVPIAALLTVRQRRRSGRSITYPLAILVGASLLSLAAQLAVATPSPSGWLLSSVPTLAFMALTKLVLSELPAAAPTLGVRPEGAASPPGVFDEPKSDLLAPAVRLTSQATAADIAPIEQGEGGKRKRVPSDVLRAQAVTLLSAPNRPTKAAVAAELGVSDRRLRQVLSNGDKEKVGA